MKQRVLITGSSGLVGTALSAALRGRGVDVVGFDLRAIGDAWGDIRDHQRLRGVVGNVDGIVHLAAVSRVAIGERAPEHCWATNVHGLRNVIEAAAQSTRLPWLVFASSREVYGQPDEIPVSEDFPLRPVNVYGRSKAQGEHLVEEARRAGIRACVIRLSNVFGSTADHEDRVVPAFARAAALGRELRVDGVNRVFDFTHVDDVARGFVALIELLAAGEGAPPPIHLVTGRPTALGELAQLAVRIGRSSSTIHEAAPREFDVSRFVGDPSRAEMLLGWQPRIRLEDGLKRLIREFRDTHRGVEMQELGR